jgi:hypothetical protein
MPLTTNNIKAELSYAVLHAIAARAGFSCVETDRHTDDMGVDAEVLVRERFTPESILTEFKLHFQLKATSQPLPFADGKHSFSMKAAHYDKARRTDIDAPRYVAIFTMPEADTLWLEKSPEQLVCRKCLRWVSLRSASAGNASDTTIYVPDAQLLTVNELRRLAAMRSREEWIDYGG